LNLDKIRPLESDGFAILSLALMDSRHYGVGSHIYTKIGWAARRALSDQLEIIRRFSFGQQVYYRVLQEISRSAKSTDFKERLNKLTKILRIQIQNGYRSEYEENDETQLKEIAFKPVEMAYLSQEIRKTAIQLANEKYPQLRLKSPYELSIDQSNQALSDQVTIAFRNDFFARKIYYSSCTEFRRDSFVVVYMGAAHLSGVKVLLEKMGLSNIETYYANQLSYSEISDALKRAGESQ